MPAETPEEVEALVREIGERNPNYSDAQKWATAWSVYCKSIEPGSEHCEHEPSWYLPDRDNPGHIEDAIQVRRTERHKGQTFELLHLGPVEDGDDGWHRWELHQDGETVLACQWPNDNEREVWDHLASTWIMYWKENTS